MLTETALKGRNRRPAWASDARVRSAKMTKSCKSPRFERRCAAYKCIADVLQVGDWQVGGRDRRGQNWKYRNSSRCHIPNSEIATADAVTSAHAAFGRQRSLLARSGARRYSR